MSSWKKASKINQKTHRERHQPEARKKFGLLEKHSDYKKRANDHHRKQSTLKLLRKRALNRNPDEFYHHMINSKVEDGQHYEVCKEEMTPEKIKLMKTQDVKYINMKRIVESNKIKKLQSQLHLLDIENGIKNKHTIFLENESELKKFDIAKHFDTHPDFVNHKINRPRLSDIGKYKLPDVDIEKIKSETSKSYQELAKRIKREKELADIQKKIENKKGIKNKIKKIQSKLTPQKAQLAHLLVYERKK